MTVERPASPDPGTPAWVVAQWVPAVERPAGMLDVEPWWDPATAHGVLNQEES